MFGEKLGAHRLGPGVLGCIQLPFPQADFVASSLSSLSFEARRSYFDNQFSFVITKASLSLELLIRLQRSISCPREDFVMIFEILQK